MKANKRKLKHSPAASCRGALVIVVSAVLVKEAWRLLLPPATQLLHVARGERPRGATPTVDVLVQDVASLGLLVAVTALGALLAMAAADVVFGQWARLHAATVLVTPRACRRLVATCCGVTLLTPLALGSAALADSGRPDHACPAVCVNPVPSLAGLPLPDLPLGSGSHTGRTAAVGEQTNGHRARLTHLVVRPGDSLWRIAERLLAADTVAAPDAPDAAIEELTEQLYALNRARIGADPDLILPGTALLAPVGTT